MKQMNLKQKLTEIVSEENIIQDEPMKEHVTFRVGGPARYFITPENQEEIQKLLRLCAENEIPYFILGRGSNLLVSDQGFDGVVICLQKNWNQCRIEGNRIYAQSGAMLPAVAQAACQHGLSGLEFASGIPGTIGGGLRMNAGAYGGEIKDVVVEADAITPQGEVVKLSAEGLKLGYRTSIIGMAGYTVLSCVLELAPGKPEEIRRLMEEYNAKRREKQPLEYGSAGSTFKRPQGYFAGKLIQDAGMRGYRIGDAQVSEKHAGFVINRGNATACQILQLCEEVKKKVYETSGVMLEMEIRKIGPFPS